MKKILAVLMSGVCLLGLFSACQQDGDVVNLITTTTTVSEATEENTNFETCTIPLIFDNNNDIADTCFARIYDKNEYVPYVGIQYWLQEKLGVNVISIYYSKGEYIINADLMGKSFPLVVNTKKNTITCPSYAAFSMSAPDIYMTSDTKMFDIKSILTGQKSVTYELSKYGFKLYGSLEDVYAPLCVMNQLFTSPILNFSLIYNGVSLYYYNVEKSNYSTFKDSPWYKDLKHRPKELIDLSYRTLCIYHDYIYGKPGYYGFADAGNGYADPVMVAEGDSLTLDELLTKKDPETKALLLSESYADYLKGLKQLTMKTCGDLHSRFRVYSDSFLLFGDSDIISAYDAGETSAKNERYLKKRGIVTENGKPTGELISGSLEDWRAKKGIAEFTTDAEGTKKIKIKADKELELIDSGKTLILRFDVFEFNSQGWRTYYSNSPVAEPDPADVPADTIGLFYKAFYLIKRDKEAGAGDYKDVKTVLIDDSCNGGGTVLTCNYILDLITGSGDYYYDDVHTGSKYHEVIKADLNLDGKVDDDDREYRSFIDDLNIAILTSFRSFSCGNAFPFCAKDRKDSKIKIIGERSGGGCCMLGSAVTADGFPYNYSFNRRICSSDFSKTAEGGAEVDYGLTVGDDFSADFYSKYFDNDSLIAALKEVFGLSY